MRTRQKVRWLWTITVVFAFSMLITNYSIAEEKGLVGYWKFDEGKGNIAKDSLGMGNDGTISGGATYTKGVSGSGLKFDGVDGYVDCGNNASLNITDTITIEAWVKTTIPSSTHVVAKDGFDGRC